MNLKYTLGIGIFLFLLIGSFVIFFTGEKEGGNDRDKDKQPKVELSNHTIMPKPLSYEKGEGSFLITKDTSIYVKGNTEEETESIYKIAELLKSKLKPSTGFDLNIVKGDNPTEGSIYLTTIGGEENQGNEGYKINVSPEKVHMTSYKPEGLARGIQTLRGMLPSDIEKTELVSGREWTIPAATINDKPEYEYRGLMIDVARRFYTVDEVKRQIDLAAQYKINKVHLHLTDDQGWRLEIKKWPDLTTIGGSTQTGGGKGGYYTQEDFKNLVRYASERYIEIIPEFDMPGHSTAAQASYGFLNEDGIKKDIYTSINVGFSSFMCRDEKTYEFIEDVIREIAEISPSKYFHIGGDEADSTKEDDYNYFVGRVSKIAQKYGKTPIGWDPIDTSPEIDSNVILQSWSNTSNKKAKEKEMKMIISKAEKSYLDMKYNENTPYGQMWAGYSSVIDAYKWDPTDYAPKELVLGIEAPLWTEAIRNQDEMDYMIYPRLIGHAEVGWSPKESRSWEDYYKRLKGNYERMKNQGINFQEE